jgi:hypothetical protein
VCPVTVTVGVSSFDSESCSHTGRRPGGAPAGCRPCRLGHRVTGTPSRAVRVSAFKPEFSVRVSPVVPLAPAAAGHRFQVPGPAQTLPGLIPGACAIRVRQPPEPQLPSHRDCGVQVAGRPRLTLPPSPSYPGPRRSPSLPSLSHDAGSAGQRIDCLIHDSIVSPQRFVVPVMSLRLLVARRSRPPVDRAVECRPPTGGPVRRKLYK